MASSSFSSYFLLLCLSMFLAVSSLGNPISNDFDYSGFGSYDDDEPDFDYPQSPAPESEDGGDYGYVYDNDYPQSPAPESDGGGDYGYVYDNDYPQSPAPESDGGADYGYVYDTDYPQAPESDDGGDYGYVYVNDFPQSPAPATGDGSDYDSDTDSGDIPDNYLSLEADYCPDVVEGISTCQDFLNGHEDSPSAACCDRLYDLSFIGVEVGLRDMCDCFKDLQASFHQSRAEDEIFKSCGFDYSLFPISQQECSKY